MTVYHARSNHTHTHTHARTHTHTHTHARAHTHTYAHSHISTLSLSLCLSLTLTYSLSVCLSVYLSLSLSRALSSQIDSQTRTDMYAHNSRARSCRQTNMQHIRGKEFDLGSKRCDTGLKLQTKYPKHHFTCSWNILSVETKQ